MSPFLAHRLKSGQHRLACKCTVRLAGSVLRQKGPFEAWRFGPPRGASARRPSWAGPSPPSRPKPRQEMQQWRRRVRNQAFAGMALSPRASND